MANVEFDDKSVGNKQDFIKLPLGISRGAILTSQAVMEHIHWDGGYIKCNGPQQCMWCMNGGKEKEERFASWLLLYNTNNEGMPYEPLTFRIEPWSYGADKFGVLRLIKTNFGDLRKVDLIFTVTEFKYQKMTIQAIPQCWWQANEQFKMAVVEQFKKKSADFALEKKIARYISFQEQGEFIAKRKQRGNPQGQQAGANVGFNPMAAVQGMVQQSPGMMQGFGGMPSFGVNPGINPTGPTFSTPSAPEQAQAPILTQANNVSPPQLSGEVNLDALLDGMNK